MTAILAAELVAWVLLVAIYAAGHWATYQALYRQDEPRRTCRLFAALWPLAWVVGAVMHLRKGKR